MWGKKKEIRLVFFNSDPGPEKDSELPHKFSDTILSVHIVRELPL
jgi:hypothetical protein